MLYIIIIRQKQSGCFIHFLLHTPFNTSYRGGTYQSYYIQHTSYGTHWNITDTHDNHMVTRWHVGGNQWQVYSRWQVDGNQWQVDGK